MSEGTFISKLASHIQSHYDLTKQELTVVFPNKRAAFYLRNAFHLAAANDFHRRSRHPMEWH